MRTSSEQEKMAIKRRRSAMISSIFSGPTLRIAGSASPATAPDAALAERSEAPAVPDPIGAAAVTDGEGLVGAAAGPGVQGIVVPVLPGRDLAAEGRPVDPAHGEGALAFG